jgi:hypothetical protein
VIASSPVRSHPDVVSKSKRAGSAVLQEKKAIDEKKGYSSIIAISVSYCGYGPN